MQDVIVRMWAASHPATAQELLAALSREGRRPYSWSNGPGDRYPAHSHGYHKVIVVVRGSITFVLPTSERRLHLQAGDRLELPAGVVHSALVGPDGVTCLEAHD